MPAGLATQKSHDFDNKLDRMLEDLKSTVTSEDESPGFRSSGRSPSRSLANGRTVDTGLTGSGRPSLDMGHPMDVGLCTSNETHTTSDGGRVSHHRKEYASPDNSVRTYADTYQYDSGPAQQGQHFQKKVMKSTYSSYNTEGGLSKDLQDLKKGPSDQEMDRALSESSRNIINSSKYSTSSVERKEDRRVVDASHSVARELVDALSVIGSDTESTGGHRSNLEDETPEGSTAKLNTITENRYLVTEFDRDDTKTFHGRRIYEMQPGSIPEDETPEGSTVMKLDTITENRYAVSEREHNNTKTSAMQPDASTLGRLRKNITELGQCIETMDDDYGIGQNIDELSSMIEGFDDADLGLGDESSTIQQRNVSANRVVDYTIEERNVSDIRAVDSTNEQRRSSSAVRAVGSTNEQRRDSSAVRTVDSTIEQRSDSEIRAVDSTTERRDSSAAIRTVDSSRACSHRCSDAGVATSNVSKALQISESSNEGKSLNGGYISDDMLCKDEKGGEVRRIVWRNRYEKTYEAGDTAPPQPSMSIERDARSLRVDVPEDPTLGGLTRPHVPPQMSPATPQPGRSHVDMTSSSHHTSNHTTTSHNLREETNKYSSDNRYNDTTPRHLPEGNTHTTPRHLPEGNTHTTPRHLPEGNTHTYSSVNTIRDTSNDTYGRPTPVLPPSSPPTNKNNFNYSLSSSEHYTRDTRNNDRYPNNDLPLKPYEPPMKERSPSPPRYARIESSPTRNITININKSHTTTTTTTDDTRGGLPPYSDGPSPVTSTPYHRGSSRSPDRTRKQPPYASGPSDSLDRVRRPPNQGLPFPSPSPNAPGSTPVPRKVDELMSDFSSERAYDWERTDREPLMRNHQKAENGVHLPPPERNDINTVSPRELQEREKTKNTAGAAVYYPPTQENFQESMHTMTLKEGGRRGKAKWRAEGKSGYKESSSHSEMKGGATMVPVCLPLCCGAACSIM